MNTSSEIRQKYIYPTLSIATIFLIIFFNFNDDVTLPFEFPSFLTWQMRDMDFVGVNGTHFVMINGGKDEGGTKVYVNGWNSYWMLSESKWGPGSRAKVSRMFKRGAEMGLTVCRTWAFSDGPGPSSIQISPGVFNHRVLKGLDYIIVEARKNGIRLILSLVNNLSAFGGKEQYVKWAEEAAVDVSSSADPFFSDPTIKGYYKAYVKAILTRKNSLSGVKYSEEPAIFAWELMNEPRCDANSSSLLQSWIEEMAAYVKSLDKNHLVTIGLEGFYGLGSGNSGENPGEWAASLGTDFIRNSAVDAIDFASIHAYPDSWMPHADEATKLDFISHWLDSHINESEKVLKKPVLVTEVGFPVNVRGQGVNDRDTLLKVVYDRIFESAKKGQAGAGALIWQLLAEGMEEYRDRFSLVAWKNPSTYKLIVEQSCRLSDTSWNKSTRAKVIRNDLCSGLVA